MTPSIRSRGVRALFAVAGGTALLLGLGVAALYAHNLRASAAYHARPDPRGRLVDVGGHRAFVSVRGKGGPAVVIEAGFGASAEWWPIQDSLARHTTVVSYDRAGYGFSTDSAAPRDAAAIAAELRKVLARAGVAPPYVLVGEGLGGLFVQRFARSRPGEVAAVVLVDPITTFHARFEQELSRAFYQNLIHLTPRIAAGRALAALGLVRALEALPFEGRLAAPRRPLVEFYASPRSYGTMLAEYRALAASIAQVDRAGGFPDVPLAVIHHCPGCFVDELLFFQMSYDEAEALERLWQQVHRDTARLSSRGRLVLARAAKRHLHVEEPQSIVDAVLEVVTEARAPSARR